jgi:hypothetical protein
MRKLGAMRSETVVFGGCAQNSEGSKGCARSSNAAVCGPLSRAPLPSFLPSQNSSAI